MVYVVMTELKQDHEKASDTLFEGQVDCRVDSTGANPMWEGNKGWWARGY
jgi:hypothetical protein